MTATGTQTTPAALTTAQRVASHPRPLQSSQLDPRTLASCAAALLLIDDAYTYGLIDSDPGVDRSRCKDALDYAATLGIVVDEDEVQVKALELMAEIGVLRG